jgi:hypothetical protein
MADEYPLYMNVCMREKEREREKNMKRKRRRKIGSFLLSTTERKNQKSQGYNSYKKSECTVYTVHIVGKYIYTTYIVYYILYTVYVVTFNQ